MAADGDTQRPDPTPTGAPALAPDHGRDPDDGVGFCTPASLAARPLEPEPAPEPAPGIEPETAPLAEPMAAPRIEPLMSDPVTPAVFTPAPQAPPAPRKDAPRRDAAPAPLGLYAVYALILFAVPTFGASALLGLLAVTGREPPADPLAASHFTYQQRSLWAAAVAVAAGAILIVVGMGVFVLFLAAIWLLIRGAAGVLKLKAGQPIADPRGWWI